MAINSFFKKTLKFLLYSVFVYALILISLLALTPTLLSISSIRKYAIETFIHPRIEEELEINHLDLSWFGKQRALGITLFDKEHASIASLDSIEVNNSLIYLLFTNKLTEIDIENIEIIFDERLSKPSLFKKPILLQDASLSFRLGSMHEPFKLISSGKILNQNTQEDIQGHYNIHAEIDPAILNCQEMCKDYLVHLQGEFHNIPTQLIQDGLSLFGSGSEIQLKEIFGDDFSATINQVKEESSNTVLFELQSSYTQSRFELEISQGSIHIKEPAHFLFRSPTKTYPPFELTLYRLQLPFSYSKLPFDIQGKFKSHALHYGDLHLNHVNGEIENKPGEPLHLSLSAELAEENYSLAGATIHFSSPIEIHSNAFHLPHFSILLEKENLPPLQLQGDLHAIFGTTLEQGIKLNLVTEAQIAPEWTELYIGNFSDYSISRKPLDVRFSISKTIIPYSGPLIQQIYSEGGLSIQELTLKKTSEHNLEKLSKLSVRWVIDGSKNKASLRFKTYLHYLGETSPNKIRFITNIYHWQHQGNINLMSSRIDAEAKLPNMPTGFFGLLLNQPYLKEIVGPSVRLNFKLNYYPDQQKDSLLEFGVTSQAINAFGELSIGNTTQLRDLDEPITLEWLLTPQRIEALRKVFSGLESDQLRELELLNDSKLKISVEDLSFQTPKHIKELGHALSHGAMTLQFRLNPFSVNDPGQKMQTHFEKIFGEVVTKPHNSNVAFTMKMKGTSGIERKRFDSVVTGYVDETFNPDGSLATDRLVLSLTSTHKRSPLSLLCEFLFPSAIIGQSISPLIGEYVDGHIELKTKSIHEGVFNANLSGENGQLKVSGEIKNKFLTLDQPLTASLKVTPQLGKSVLSYLNPLLSAISHSEQSIKLNVPKEGVRIPLTGGNISQLDIPSITLDIGKVHFNNVDSVNTILEVLNHQASPQVNIWLLPIYASVDKGILKISRVDMLIDQNFPIAMWGKVDLIKDKLKLKLGLTPLALYRSRGIQIATDTLFILPIIGSSSRPSIDVKKAAGRIASESLKGQGIEGQIPAFALDLLTGNLKEQETPKPTTLPLPWEINLPGHASEKSVIQNSAEKLLQKIFK